MVIDSVQHNGRGKQTQHQNGGQTDGQQHCGLGMHVVRMTVMVGEREHVEQCLITVLTLELVATHDRTNRG